MCERFDLIDWCEEGKEAGMEVDVEGLRVYFPYPRIYKEQYQYMVELKVPPNASVAAAQHTET